MDSPNFLHHWRSPSHDSTSSQRSGAHSFQPTRATPSMFTFYPSLPLYSQGSQPSPGIRKPIFNPFDAETDEDFDGWVDQLKGKIIHALKPEDAAREASFRKLREQLSELKTRERAFSEEAIFPKSKGKQKEKRDIDMVQFLSDDDDEQETPFENKYGDDASLMKEYPDLDYIGKESVDIRNGIFNSLQEIEAQRNGDEGDIEDAPSPISYGENEDENTSNQWDSYAQSETLDHPTNIEENGVYYETLPSKETITLSSDEEGNIDNDDGSIKTEEYADDGGEPFIFDIDGDHMSIVSMDSHEKYEEKAPNIQNTEPDETQTEEYQKEEAENMPMTPEFRNEEFENTQLTPVTAIHDEDKDVQMSPTTHYLRSREQGVRDIIQQFESIAAQEEKSNMRRKGVTAESETPLHEASKDLSEPSRTSSKRRRKKVDDDHSLPNNAEASDGSEQDINLDTTEVEHYNLRHTTENQKTKASTNEVSDPLSKHSRGSPKRRREKFDGNQSFMPSDGEGSDHDMNLNAPETEHYYLRHKTTAVGQETPISEALEYLPKHPRGSPKRHRKNRNDDQISVAENNNEASEGLNGDVDTNHRRKTAVTELNAISSEAVDQSPKRSRKSSRKIRDGDLLFASNNNEENISLENGFTNGNLQGSPISKANQETPKRRQSTSKRQRKAKNDEQPSASDSENANEVPNHIGILQEAAVIETGNHSPKRRRKSHHKAANKDQIFVPEDEKINESSEEEDLKTPKRVKRSKSNQHDGGKRTRTKANKAPKAKDSAESSEEPSAPGEIANDTKRHRGRPRKKVSKTGEKTSNKVSTPSRSRQSRLNNSSPVKMPEINHFDATQTPEPPSTPKIIESDHDYGNGGGDDNEIPIITDPNVDLEALLRNHDCSPDSHESLMNLLRNHNPPETHEKLREFFTSHDHRAHSPSSEISTPLSQPFETDGNDHEKPNDGANPDLDNSDDKQSEKTASRRSRIKITSNYYLRSKCPLRSLILATNEGRQYYIGKSCLIEAPHGSAVKRRKREGTSASQGENQDQDEMIPETVETVELQAEVVPENILEDNDNSPKTKILWNKHAPPDFLRSAKKLQFSPRKSSRLLEANKDAIASEIEELTAEELALEELAAEEPPSPSTRHGKMYANLGEDDMEV